MDYTIEFSHGIASLNEEQYRVVTSPATENQRILASAGSGKTTTITARIAYLMEEYGILPSQIILVTFSRAAAHEMIHRVHRLTGPVDMYAGTFHSLCRQILRDTSPHALKDQPFIDELPYRLVSWLATPEGRQWVRSFTCIIVDEFQDINEIQWQMLEGLRGPHTTMTIVGDDAQNIYTWRGSSVDFILRFHEYMPRVQDYQLCRNYRSTEAIVSIANSVMRFIPTLPFKEKMVAHVPGGRRPEVHFFYRSSDECDWMVHSVDRLRIKFPTLTIAILSRYNSDLYKMEDRLHLKRVPYHMNHSEEETPNTTTTTHATATAIHTTTQPRPITLATLHGSKGLEWDIVFFMNLHDDVFPLRKTEADVICERRLFYVGVTRAKKALYLTYSRQEHSLSRFVREIPRPLLRFHNVASFKLSDGDTQERRWSMEDLVNGMDGGDWNVLRQRGDIPLIERMPMDAAAAMQGIDTMYPFATFVTLPDWAVPLKDTWVEWLRWISLREGARYLDQMNQLLTPQVDQTLLTLRIYREDMEFWEQYAAEMEHLAHHFLPCSPTMPPIEYERLQQYVEGRLSHLTWNAQDIAKAAIILAKLRGQLRPMRHHGFRLHDFSFGYVRHTVPTDLRPDVLQSWHRVMDTTRRTSDLLPDLWRMAALTAVHHGRNVPLYQTTAVLPYLESAEQREQIQRMEQAIPLWMAQQDHPSFHFQFDPEVIAPIQFDMMTDRCAYQFFFDPYFVPSTEDKILLLLKQYLYEETYDRCLDSIGFLNLASGTSILYQITPTIREQLSHLWQYLQHRFLTPAE